MKLLHYTTPDCLNKPNLSVEERNAMIGKEIKNVPKLSFGEHEEVRSYILLEFDDLKNERLLEDEKELYILGFRTGAKALMEILNLKIN